MIPTKPSLSSANFLSASPRARVVKQQRSAERQRRIEEAAVTVIAEHGIANLTHRLVAKEAGVSLAATTYHYHGRHDIIADAAARLLEGYVEAFRRFLGRHSESSHLSFNDFVMRVITKAVSEYRMGTLAWCEIILDSTWNAETRSIATSWFENLFNIWLDIATVFGVKRPEQTVRSAIDVVVGLIFIGLSLGLDGDKVAAVIEKGKDPHLLWAEPATDDLVSIPVRGNGRKAEETRERILSAAMDILIERGAGCLSYKAVAARTGMTAPSAIYYFPTIESLLDVAQARLFEASKQRYRSIMASVDYGAIDADHIADLTAAIFQREATEFATISVADYPIWMEAARHPRLRPSIWAAISDQQDAWKRLLCHIIPTVGIRDALLMQSLFRGKLIRTIATGSKLGDLAGVRQNFAYVLDGLESRNGLSL